MAAAAHATMLDIKTSNGKNEIKTQGGPGGKSTHSAEVRINTNKKSNCHFGFGRNCARGRNLCVRRLG